MEENMDGKSDKAGPPPFTKMGITPEQAAAASIAQSLAFAAQNEVDAFRNQNTVGLVTMGAAYAKWLQNPMMANEYSKIVKSAQLIDTKQVPAADKVLNRMKSENAGNSENAGTYTLPDRIFNHFLSDADESSC